MGWEGGMGTEASKGVSTTAVSHSQPKASLAPGAAHRVAAHLHPLDELAPILRSVPPRPPTPRSSPAPPAPSAEAGAVRREARLRRTRTDAQARVSATWRELRAHLPARAAAGLGGGQWTGGRGWAAEAAFWRGRVGGRVVVVGGGRPRRAAEAGWPRVGGETC